MANYVLIATYLPVCYSKILHTPKIFWVYKLVSLHDWQTDK